MWVPSRARAALSVRAHGDFACGSCGPLRQLAPDTWELTLRDDGDDARLPAAYRAWWAACLEDVPPGRPLVLRVVRLGWPFSYLPVASPDGLAWAHLPEGAATLDGPEALRIALPRPPGRLYLAQTEPYGLARLHAFLARELVGRPGVRVGTLPGCAAVPLVEVGPAAAGERIWVHARAHPGEMGASFAAEGLLLALRDRPPTSLRRGFSVVPCLNPGGVAAGRGRTDVHGRNLEELWEGAGERPPEVAAAQAYIGARAAAGTAWVAALNLHSSNEPPTRRPYALPHFAPDAAGSPPTAGGRLYARQRQFIAALGAALGRGRLEPASPRPGAAFLATPYPETWWWRRTGAATMALTVETVYGRAGAGGRWMVPDDHRALGAALLRACDVL